MVGCPVPPGRLANTVAWWIVWRREEIGPVRTGGTRTLHTCRRNTVIVNRKPIRTIPALAIPLALATTGCEVPQSSPAARVVDSVGVRVVDLGAAPLDLAEHRTLAAEPDLVIGSGEDDRAHVFSDVRDVEVLPSGRVAVVNGSGNDILVFDAAGRHVDTWGGRGDGPGEFRYLEWLALLPPDSLASGDGGLRRVTIFDAAGRYVRNSATAVAVDPVSHPIPPRPMGLLADGSVIAASFEQPEPVEGTARPTGRGRDDSSGGDWRPPPGKVARRGGCPLRGGWSPGGNPASVRQTPPHRARARRRLDRRRRSMGGAEILGAG